MRHGKNEALDNQLAYDPLPVVTIQITETIEADILEDAKAVAQRFIEHAKPQKPDDERQNIICVIHGLNSNNIAKIQWIDCDRCRSCWMNHVAEKGKRRAPAAPPGLEPIDHLKDVYDAERALGSFINLVNSGRADSPNLANYGDVAQSSSYALPLFGCVDATHPEYRGLCPKVEYNSASRTPEDVAIEELGEMLVRLLCMLDPQNMLYDPTNNHCELDRPNVPSREERCEQLTKLDTMIHKIRAALISLARQLGQLLIRRHKYGHRFGTITQIVALERLICTTGFKPYPCIKARPLSDPGVTLLTS